MYMINMEEGVVSLNSRIFIRPQLQLFAQMELTKNQNILDQVVEGLNEEAQVIKGGFIGKEVYKKINLNLGWVKK